MKSKKLFVSIVTLVCLMSLILCACGANSSNNAAPNLPADSGATQELVEAAKTFTLQIVHADGTVKEQEISTKQEFLANALFDEKILTEQDALKTGMYTIVDGEEASWDKDQAYWGFYVNGQYAVEGMNTTEIEDGAVYRLEYTVG